MSGNPNLSDVGIAHLGSRCASLKSLALNDLPGLSDSGLVGGMLEVMLEPALLSPSCRRIGTLASVRGDFNDDMTTVTAHHRVLWVVVARG